MNHGTERDAAGRFQGSAARRFFTYLCGLVLVFVASSCSDDDDDNGGAPAVGIEILELGDGLELTILSAEVGADRKVVVEFVLEDGEGTPADLSQLDGNPSFVIASIAIDPENGYTRYQSYVLQTVDGEDFVFDGMTMPPALENAEQAAADSDGFFETFEPGFHRYTFGTVLPEDFDRTATHSVGV